MSIRTLLIAVLGIVWFTAGEEVPAQSFTPLGDLPGGRFFSWVSDVSADGSVVVGFSESEAGEEAFRWTKSDGMVGLGDLPGGAFGSRATGVSADGSVVVGRSRINRNGPGAEAFRWTEPGGMVGLGDLASGGIWSGAKAVSADGSVVVGTGERGSGDSPHPDWEAFRWTKSGGMVGLGELPGGDFSSGANALSADGSVVVGTSRSGSGTEAFRWTESDGIVGLGDLPGGHFCSGAARVSSDGSVIVGFGESKWGQEAYRWTKSGGMVALGDLPGGNFSSAAIDVSADGSIVVGHSDGKLGCEAFIWDEQNGMRSLQAVLQDDYGLDLTGWKLHTARAISDDGKVIVGWGFNPDGHDEGWVCELR